MDFYKILIRKGKIKKGFEEKIDYCFKNKKLLREALTHKSYFYECNFTPNNSSKKNSKSPSNNERLEFLGDSVLDLILSEMLMLHYPSYTEGELSKKRASLVNEMVLANIAKELYLNKYLLLGKSEINTQGNEKPRLLASALEAVIGAIFLDGGYKNSKKVIEKLFVNKIKIIDEEDEYYSDHKTKLQEFIQKKYKITPGYFLIAEKGPAHKKKFQVVVKVKDDIIANGEGNSKKQAEQKAAYNALEILANNR